MSAQLRQQLAPTGVLRAAINMSNFLLVTGNNPAGEPTGVSPDIAQALAASIDVDCQLIPYKGPGELADDAVHDKWDIGNIAAEPERAKTITFSRAYCEIQATYLVPANSLIKTLKEVDVSGNRIAVKERAAYQLWLTDNLQQASLVMADSIDGSFDVFVAEGLEALAGLRPKLLEQQQRLPGSVVLDESFTAIQQAVGCPQDRPLAAKYINEFVDDAIKSDLVLSLLRKHEVLGPLSVAS